MSDAVVPQCVGFRTQGAVREYAFALRGTNGESTEYFVTIANAAFVEHGVRNQGGPDVCSLRLHREFTTQADHFPSTCLSITHAELADYKQAHTPKSKPRASAHSEDNES